MSDRITPVRVPVTLTLVGAGLIAWIGASTALIAQNRRDFDVVARKYGFHVAGSDAAEIHVRQNDLVHVTFSSDDIPHSFTIDAPYRIMRRAEPGKSVSFDFLADEPGHFPFFCNLRIDEKCKDMKGVLIVDRAP